MSNTASTYEGPIIVGLVVSLISGLPMLSVAVRGAVIKSRAAEADAAKVLRQAAVNEGYKKRSGEIRPVIDRVNGLLELALSEDARPVDIERRLNKAMQELSDAREGTPDDD